MSTYQFTARDFEGKTQKGSVEAPDLASFYTELRDRGLFCMSYTESRPVERRVKTIHKMKVKELVIFCRKLGTMLSAGVNMSTAFDTLVTTAQKAASKQLFISMYEDIQTGVSMSQAMRNQGRAFPPFLVNMVDAGEASGNLDEIFQKLSTHYESENKLRKKIKAATTYPIILSIISLFVIILMFTTILPKLLTSIGGLDDMPPLTQFMMSISNFFVSNWYWVVGLIVAVILVIVNNSRIPPVKRFIDRLKLYAPIFGKLNRVIYSARFSRSLSMLYSSGIPLITSMRLCANVLGNTKVSDLFQGVTQNVSVGEPLWSSIDEIHLFDPLLPSMIRVGEESGQLDSVLANISDYYDSESEAASLRMVSLIEPIMLIALGVIICLVLVAVMLPILSMYSSIGG